MPRRSAKGDGGKGDLIVALAVRQDGFQWSHSPLGGLDRLPQLL
jgi:hypothetical protein